MRDILNPVNGAYPSQSQYTEFILNNWDQCLEEANVRWKAFLSDARGAGRKDIQELAARKWALGAQEHGILEPGTLDTLVADQEENIDKVNYAGVFLYDRKYFTFDES